MVVHDIFCALLVRFFGKVADFINFETDGIDGDAVIDKCDPVAQTVSQFFDDETQIDENIEDYYAFTNVCRGVRDARQDSFLKSDSSESQQHEVNNYCNDNYDPKFEYINEFRDSAKRIEKFKNTILCPKGLENQNSFYSAIIHAIRY